VSTEYIPYTYLIGWSAHNKWYYGRRTAAQCHPSELWVKYFTSSKRVKDFAKIHGNPDVIQIRKIFPDAPKKCCIWESKVLQRIDAQNKEMWINEKNGDEKWDTTGISMPRNERTKEKCKNTLLKKYGVTNPSHNSLVKQKRKETFQQRYGVNNSFHRADFLDKAKKTWIEKYGVDNPNKRQVVCEHCGETTNIAHVKQCKSNPNKVYSGLPGTKNHKAKIFVIEDPTGKIYEVAGWFTYFCKQHQISPRLLREQSHTKGWKLISVRKIH